MPRRPMDTKLAFREGAIGGHRWRLVMALVVAGAGLSALGAWATAHSAGHVDHVAVGATATTVANAPGAATDRRLLLPPTSTSTTASPSASPSASTRRLGSPPVGRSQAGHTPVQPGTAVHSRDVPVGHTISGPGLWLVARDGSVVRQVGARPEATAWSPDDQRIAVGLNGAIDILGVAGGTVTHLANLPGPILFAMEYRLTDEEICSTQKKKKKKTFIGAKYFGDGRRELHCAENC